jgi:bifunctional DNA primase/polymerase-like protein/uncharacterized protein DUF5906
VRRGLPRRAPGGTATCGARLTRLEHALRLAADGFFVFPLLPGKKTPPKGMHFKEQATRDEVQIRAWWVERDWNIGIYTGRFADNDALAVVDVDPKKGGYESLLRCELEGLDFPSTREHGTPSGGRHILYRVPAPGVKQGADVLGQGLDIRSKGGYVVGPGSELSVGAYIHLPGAGIAVADCGRWIVDRCGRATERTVVRDPVAVAVASAEARAVHYLKHEAPVGTEGARNDTGYKVAARVKDLGADEPACLALMVEHWPCVPALDRDELAHVVHSAYRYGDAAIGSAAPEADFKPVPLISGSVISDSPLNRELEVKHPFEQLNRDHAFVLAGGGDHILWETHDADGLPVLVHLNTGSFHRRHAALEIQVGKRSAPVTEEWMRWKGRRSYDGLVFLPERLAPDRFYNLWRGFAVQPAARPDHPAVTAFLEHARANVCVGDDKLYRWLMGFFAHLVQRPWEKPLVALVFKGEKGVGKNALVRIVGALLGRHSMTVSNRRYLISNFNGHLESLLMFTLDEATWAGDKQAEGVLKDLITGDRHAIEHKGEKVYEVANLTRIVIIGNEDWLVPASHDERRYAVFDVGAGRKQDRPYFIAMREGMEQGGYAALLRYLLDYDLTGIDVSGAPSTAGLMEQKHASLDAFPGWWLTCLHDGKLVGGDFETAWPTECDKERFRSAFRRYAKDRNVRGWIPDDRALGRMLQKFAPSVTVGRLGSGYTYKLPSLEAARAEWSAYIGHAVKWEQ